MGLGWQTWKGHACHLCMELSVAGRGEQDSISHMERLTLQWGASFAEDRKACPVKALQGLVLCLARWRHMICSEIVPGRDLVEIVWAYLACLNDTVVSWKVRPWRHTASDVKLGVWRGMKGDAHQLTGLNERAKAAPPHRAHQATGPGWDRLKVFLGPWKWCQLLSIHL